jgi:hypothetical protein
MNNTDFEKILDTRIKAIRETLAGKAKEYASADRLYNFKRAAEIDQTTPEAALKGMWLKHVVSVLDLISGKLERSEHMINEKIGDSVNYLILLEAVLKEKLNSQPVFIKYDGIGETLLSPENVKKMREITRKLYKSANIVSDKKPTAAFICENTTRIALAGKPVSVFCRKRKGPCEVYEQWAKGYDITDFEYSSSVDTVIKVNTCTKSYTQIDVAKND